MLLCGSKLEIQSGFDADLSGFIALSKIRTIYLSNSKSIVEKLFISMLGSISTSVNIRLFICFSCFRCHGRRIITADDKVCCWRMCKQLGWFTGCCFDTRQIAIPQSTTLIAFLFCGRVQSPANEEVYFWDWKINSDFYARLVVLGHRLEGKQNNRQLSPNESKIKANTQLAFDCLCHHSFQHFNWIFDLISIGLLCRIECHWRNVADCKKSRSSLSVDDWGGNVMSANMCGRL